MSAQPPPSSLPPEAPWHAGLRAARAHLKAGIALQVFALAVVLAYYWHPPTHALFVRLAELRLQTGLLLSIAGTALCGGVLPFIYLKANPETRHGYTWVSGVFFTLFWAYKGIEVDYWYRALAWMVGNDASVRTVFIKVLLDQLVYCPVWAVTITVLAYAWHNAGFRLAPLRADFRAGHWYSRQILPGVLANIGLWGPITAFVYALPLPLQLPLFDIVLMFYTLLIAHITQRKA